MMVDEDEKAGFLKANDAERLELGWHVVTVSCDAISVLQARMRVMSYCDRTRLKVTS